MPSIKLIEELKTVRANLRGLAARAVINYVITELDEAESVSEEEVRNVLRNALNLVEIEEDDIRRVREIIERMINS